MLTNHEADNVAGFRAMLQRRRAGVTLIELVVVLLILVALATITIPLVSDESSSGRTDSTRATIVNLRTAVIRYWNDRVLTHDSIDPTLQESKRLLHVLDHVTENRQDTSQLVFLMINPRAGTSPEIGDGSSTFDPRFKLGWNGPYISEATGSYTINNATNFTSQYGKDDDAAFIDGWGRPIVIQHPGSMNGVQDVRLISAGSNGVIESDPTVLTDNLVSTGDDIYVSFQLR